MEGSGGLPNARRCGEGEEHVPPKIGDKYCGFRDHITLTVISDFRNYQEQISVSKLVCSVKKKHTDPSRNFKNPKSSCSSPEASSNSRSTTFSATSRGNSAKFGII
jgi:hypothetical protein